jgi:hypothetical protein
MRYWSRSPSLPRTHRRFISCSMWDAPADRQDSWQCKLPVLLFLGIFCGFSDTGRRGRRRLSDCPLASPAGCRNIQWLWLIGRRRPSGDRGELRSAPPPKRRGWNKGAPPPLGSPWPCWCVRQSYPSMIGRTAAQAKWSKGGLSIIERMQCMGLS